MARHDPAPSAYEPDDARSDAATARSRRPWLSWLILLFAAFAAGLFTMGYVLTHWDAAAHYLRGGAPATPVSATTAPLPRPAAAPPIVLAPSTPVLDGVDRRVAELEGRIAGVDAQAAAAAGNASRAEGLLIAFAARRALDRGVALGYLEALLRRRFGATQPQPVATVISAARQPVTLEDLRGGLSAIGPALVGRDPDAGLWQGLQRALSGMVVIRRANTPSVAPDDRLARAKTAIESGHVDRALVEVARLPGRDVAADWIAQARRYAVSRAALDTLETAALLVPETPAPASGPAVVEIRPDTAGGGR